ncbi:MAG: hypothetical protein ACW9W4_07950 [Candidatus Nitrosopumilus sp. bin_7KS]
MKPLDNKFFTRGGFSSSQWNLAEKVHDAPIVDSSYHHPLHSDDLKKHQSKSRRGHQRFECGLSV